MELYEDIVCSWNMSEIPKFGRIPGGPRAQNQSVTPGGGSNKSSHLWGRGAEWRPLSNCVGVAHEWLDADRGAGGNVASLGIKGLVFWALG